MPDGLYDRDPLAWSEQQADLLRRLALGERVNAEIDWANVVEEIEDVGRSELHGCESLLEQAMLHLLKLGYGPPEPAGHWRAEARGFLRGARKRFAPSMRQHIDLADAYRAVRQQLVDEYREQAASAPTECPWTLEGLLASEGTIEVLEGKLGDSSNP